MRRISRRALRAVLAPAALLLVPALPSAAHAQQPQVDKRVRLRADGEPDRKQNANTRRRSFSLFGLADAAVAAIKTTGAYGWPTCTYANYVNGTYGGTFDCGGGWGYQQTLGPVAGGAAYTFMDWIFAAPPSARDSIVAATTRAGSPASGLAGALDAGYSVHYTGNFNATDVNLPSDGQLGAILSGLTSTRDQSCRDIYLASGLTFTSGFPLMPMSDCPATIGSNGWQGRKPVGQGEVLAALRGGTLPPDQAFDFWRYPSGEPDPAPGKLERQFGSFQTYGSWNDYTRDEVCGTPTTRTFGRVMAGTLVGQGCPASVLATPPTKPGYPLGIEVRFDAFAYAIPALSDVVFYQATVVNNSKLVYGVGVDYDSIYIGGSPAPYSDTQRNLVYYRPELNALIHTPVCSHQDPASPCNGAATPADLRPSDVISQSLGGVSFGPYGLGTAAIIMLKSPIGDMRNKLYTRTGSPFASIPGVPDAIKDDTITFQHAHLCGFRACSRNTYQLDYNLNPDAGQRQFGMASSTDLNVLGRRTPATMGGSVAGQILWHTFRSADFPSAPNVGTGPGDFPQTGGFNRWLPGTWDWNDDGQQDTLYYDTCSGKTGGNGPGTLTSACVGLFSDTMPHTGDATRRWLGGYANTGGILTVGPIPLKADDTVSFVFAATAACCDAQGDSLAIMTKVNAAIDHYMNFWLGPEPSPRDSIIATDVVGGNQDVSQVTLSFTQTAETSRDPFLLAQATRFLAADTNTAEGRLRLLNPFLVDTLLAYGLPLGQDTTVVNETGDTVTAVTGIGNFTRLYVFKSCDGGATFTNNANCTPAPATGGLFATIGWLPYAQIDRDQSGDVPNTFTDPNVNGGITYTYVLVGETRGANFTLQTGDKIRPFTFEDTVITENPDDPTVLDTTVVTRETAVCIENCLTQIVSFAPKLLNPLSTSGSNAVAVYVPATFAAGGAGPLVDITPVSGPVGASRVTVTPSALTPTAGTYDLNFFDSVSVVVQDTLDPGGTNRLATISVVRGFKGGTVTTYDSLKVLGGVGLNGAVVDPAVPTTVTGGGADPVVRTVTFGVPGMVAVLSRANSPVLVTNDLSENATPEAFFSSRAFPGFRLGFTDVSELAFDPGFGQPFIGPNGRPIATLTRPFIQLRTTLTQLAGAGQGGLYEVTWADKPFGRDEPFRLDAQNPGRVDSIVVASLTARTAADTGLVTPEVATAIGLGTAPEDLVPVKVPFRIENTSFRSGTNNTPRRVFVAMTRRTSNDILLGVGQDTNTVTVPEDVWVPGDRLILLEDTSAAGTGQLAVTFNPLVLGCDPSGGTAAGTRLSCNPVALLTTGATNYISTLPGTKEQFLYNPRLTTAQQYQITVAAQRTGTQLAAACVRQINNQPNPDFSAEVCSDVKSSIKRVKAVPNPYVAITPFTDAVLAQRTRPMYFTGVPSKGVIRIYTVSGQLVQQLSWTPQDLNETGDLQYDLRTREGLDLAAGLYLFMITGKDVNGGDIAQHMGKFVVIR